LNIKRGYLKIHIAIDIKKTRIISLDVSSEQVHDSQVLPVIIDDITIKQNKMVKMPLWIVHMTITRIFNFYHLEEINQQRRIHEFQM
jgi:hypothetical protein